MDEQEVLRLRIQQSYDRIMANLSLISDVVITDTLTSFELKVEFFSRKLLEPFDADIISREEANLIGTKMLQEI